MCEVLGAQGLNTDRTLGEPCGWRAESARPQLETQWAPCFLTGHSSSLHLQTAPIPCGVIVTPKLVQEITAQKVKEFSRWLCVSVLTWNCGHYRGPGAAPTQCQGVASLTCSSSHRKPQRSREPLRLWFLAVRRRKIKVQVIFLKARQQSGRRGLLGVPLEKGPF